MIMKLQFVERDIMKNQLPTYIGKTELNYCIMMTSAYDTCKSYEIMHPENTRD